MMILLIIPILIIILIFRNEWVFEKRTMLVNLLYDGYGKNHDVKLNDVDWDYHKMMRHFWIWNVYKMTNNPELMRKIKNYNN